MPAKRNRCGSPLCIMSSCSTPLGCDPKHLYTSWVSGHWQFCSDSSVAESHLAESLAYLLYTSICYAGPIKCVLMQERLRRHIHTHSNRTWRQVGSWAFHPCHFGKWREAACVCLCVLFTCSCVDVCRSKGCRWLSFVLQMSWQSTSSRPVGDTRGLSGRCKLRTVAAPCCFCQKNKQNWAFER